MYKIVSLNERIPSGFVVSISHWWTEPFAFFRNENYADLTQKTPRISFWIKMENIRNNNLKLKWWKSKNQRKKNRFQLDALNVAITNFYGCLRTPYLTFRNNVPMYFRFLVSRTESMLLCMCMCMCICRGTRVCLFNELNVHISICILPTQKWLFNTHTDRERD